MKDIVYRERDWGKKEEELMRRLEIYKYDPKERDVDTCMTMNAVCAVSALQLGRHDLLLKSVDSLNKFLEKYKKRKKIGDTLCEEKRLEYYEYYSHKYFADWSLGIINTQAYNIVKECIPFYFEMYKNRMRKEDKEFIKKAEVYLLCEYGYFELVRERILELDHKKKYELNEDLIYDFLGFLLMFTEFMLGMSDTPKETVEAYFQTILSERQKGNWTLIKEYFGPNVDRLYMIYYKYILELPEEELTAEHVYGSFKNGILFWRK
ncbi:MAG: hypothetical protein K5895_02490 [Lachnospiraceae bacterium]|jgi:hypothetical protein|nr:hypothetical protein [Lachnospiraceae bacterium]